MEESGRSKQINTRFGEKIRIRVCGVLIEKGCMLLANHRGLNEENELWIPPGGGQEFGENMVQGLEREYLEETGLKISVGNIIAIHEFVSPPLHALEIFYKVSKSGGSLRLGFDPELKANNQILKELRFFSQKELDLLSQNLRHQLFSHISKINDFAEFKGYFLTTAEV